MKMSFIIVIVLLISNCLAISVHSDEIWGYSCEFSGSCAQREMGMFDLKTCNLASGTLSMNMSCAERGWTVGRCCNNGNCFISSNIACGIVGGKWSSGEECPCDDIVPSCCLGTSCTETLTEQQCVQNDGVYVEDRGCDSRICQSFAQHGACCYDLMCHYIPETFCLGEWHNGTTCDAVGCFPAMNQSGTPYVHPGRCCGSYCYEQEESGCGIAFNYYEFGKSCTNYPCLPIGTCIKKDFCQERLPEAFCYLFGGTWFVGGACPDIGSCKINLSCHELPRDTCLSLEGEFDNTTVCASEAGACYDPLRDICIDTFNINCDVRLDNFSPGKNCSEIRDGTCCVSDFCQSLIPETVCNALPFSYFKHTSCETGACSQTITFENTQRELGQSVHVSNISFITTTSIATFRNASFDTSTLDLGQNSSLSFDHLQITHSVVHIDTTSKIVISGCLDMEDSELTVDLSEIDKSKLESDGQINLMQYSCILNEPSINVMNEDDCVGVSIRDNVIGLFSLSCGPTSTSIPLVFSALSCLVILTM